MKSIIAPDIMIRPALPIAHLAEPPARRTQRTRVSGFDFAFLFAAAAFIVIGSAFMLDIASARSSGHESQGLQWLTHATAWLPVVAHAAGKYLLLFVASIVNSALIVLFVQALRTTDRRLRRIGSRYLNGLSKTTSPRRVENVRGKRDHLRRQALKQREAEAQVFLLCPVFS